jgi:hypothetical protein
MYLPFYKSRNVFGNCAHPISLDFHKPHPTIFQTCPSRHHEAHKGQCDYASEDDGQNCRTESPADGNGDERPIIVVSKVQALSP